MIRGSKLGEGTFGIVYEATSPNSKTKYAVKRNLMEGPISFIGVAREVDVLNKLRGHPHIVHLEKVAMGQPFVDRPMSPLSGKERTSQRDDKLHFVFRAASYELHKFIYGATSVDFSLIKRYMVHMLLGLEYMHHKKIIHRDLKPSNVLIDGSEKDALGIANVASICDFGLSKPYTYQAKNTPGVVTAWYRAPEIALGCPTYDYKSDVWSLGCVFYEMICRRPFISKVINDDDVISAILSALPEALPLRKMRELVTSRRWRNVKVHDIARASARKSFTQQINFTVNWRAEFERKAGPLETFIHLLSKMLEFDWTDRYSARECLHHQFFTEYHPLIAATRKKFSANNMEDYCFMVRDCNERRWMAGFAINIFNNRAIFAWYSHRILFQAMDLFDRYLLAMFSGTEIPSNAVESDVKGLLYDKYNTDLRFSSCLYLCIKYFSSLEAPVSFETVVPTEFKTEQALAFVEEFEQSFIKNCLQYNIYRCTLYEYADNFNVKLDEDTICNLMILYSRNYTISGLTPRAVLTHYFEKLAGKGTDILHYPLAIAVSKPPLRLVITSVRKKTDDNVITSSAVGTTGRSDQSVQLLQLPPKITPVRPQAVLKSFLPLTSGK